MVYQMNIYELISVCPYPRNMQVFLETAYSSQTKLIRQSLCTSEHGIGYLNLAFAANKGQNRPIFSFKPLKCLEGLEIQSQSMNTKMFLIKNPLKIGNFHLAFMADKGHKGQD